MRRVLALAPLLALGAVAAVPGQATKTKAPARAHTATAPARGAQTAKAETTKARPAQAPVVSPAKTPPAKPPAPSAPHPAPAQPRSTTESGAVSSSAACPSDMKLVDGEYCTEVAQHCLKSWYDEPNKKVVCEEFRPPTRCVGERKHKRFCIDDYAWPNIKGERPEVMNNFYQAEVKCATVGKRMCTESEWTLACEGPEMKPFPYGYKRDPNKCNGDRPWDSPNMVKVAHRDPSELARLWQGVRNGEQPACISDFGVADLAGNTDDVVASETYSNDFRGKFDSVHTGGPWYKGVRNQCRPKIYTHDEGFYYYFLGFRCCSAPDGEPNDPRTPKQIKKKTPMSRIEGYARFTVEQMKKKLEQKKHGTCTCKPKDILCKTMCGTLLGPGAKDVVLTPSNDGPHSN